jgi:DNA-binding MarR family transcriptional regulator
VALAVAGLCDYQPDRAENCAIMNLRPDGAVIGLLFSTVDRRMSDDQYERVNAYQGNLDQTTGYLLGRARSVMLNMLTKESLAELGITGQQASIICILSKRPDSSAANVARECGIDASAVTRLIDKLDEHGLLTRVRNPRDRRMAHLVLTERGEKYAARFPAIAARVFGALLRGFTHEEEGFLISLLRRIVLNSEENTCPSLHMVKRAGKD